MISCGPKSSGPRADAPRLESGSPVWVQHLAGGEHPSANDLALAPDDGLVVVGAFERRLVLGDTELRASGDDDVFVARLSTKGVLAWARAFTGPGIDIAHAVAISTGGDILVAGSFHDTIDFGSVTLTATASPDAFVARLSPTGEPIWARAFGGTGVARARALATDDANNVYVAGSFDESLDVGGTVLTSAGMQDGFVAKLDGDGTTTWARSLGGASTDAVHALAITSEGDLVAAGYFRKTIELGSIELASAGDKTDVLLTTLRGADGEPTWAQRFGGAGYDAAYALAIDDRGDIVLAATFDEPAMFGGAPLEPAGDFDVALGKYTATGQHVWSLRLGGDGNEAVSHLAISGHDILVSGDFAGVAELGGTRLESAGRHDGFIARYTSDGSPLWARQLAGEGHDQLGALAAGAGGGVFAAGGFHRAARLGTQELRAQGDYELLLFELTQ